MLGDLKDMMKLHREYNRRYSKVVNQPKLTARWTIDQKGLDVFRAYTSLKKSIDELAFNTDQPEGNMQEEFGCTSPVRFNTSPLRDPQFNRIKRPEDFDPSIPVKLVTSTGEPFELNRVKRPNYGVDGVDANTIHILLSNPPKHEPCPSTSMLGNKLSENLSKIIPAEMPVRMTRLPPVILNDEWQLRLLPPAHENVSQSDKMDGDMSGFNSIDKITDYFTGRQKQHNDSPEKKYMALDVHEELTDILKVYQEGHKNLVDQEKYRMQSLMRSMREFLHVHDQKEKMEKKLTALVDKLGPEGCDCDCNEDEDEDE